MSERSDTIPAPPINPNTGELVTYEQFAMRFSELDKEVDFVKSLVNEFRHLFLQRMGNLHMKLDDDAKQLRATLDEILEGVRQIPKLVETVDDLAGRVSALESEREVGRNGHHA